MKGCRKMSENDYSCNEIYAIFVDDFIEVLTDYEYHILASSLRVRVPGFKNNSRVPIQLLKKHVSDKLKRDVNLQSFLSKSLEKYNQQYANDSFSECMKKLELDEERTNSVKLAILYQKFPIEYERYREKVMSNIKKGEPIFKGIVVEGIQFEDKIKMLSELSIDCILEKGMDHLKEKNQLIESNKTISDYFSHYPEEYKQGDLLSLLVNHFNEWRNVSDEVLLSFLFLVLKENIEENLAISKELSELNKQIEQQKEQRSKIQDKNIRLQEEKKVAENQLLNVEKQLTTVTETLVQEKEKHLKEERELQFKIKQLQELELIEKKEVPSIEPLFESESFWLLTKENHPLFTYYFTPSQMRQFDQIQELQIELNKAQFKKQPIFINTNQLSNRQQFILEKELDLAKISYRFVYGPVKEIVKKIAFYLEGEELYETHQSYSTTTTK